MKNIVKKPAEIQTSHSQLAIRSSLTECLTPYQEDMSSNPRWYRTWQASTIPYMVYIGNKKSSHVFPNKVKI
jgi:hypothetical protein